MALLRLEPPIPVRCPDSVPHFPRRPDGKRPPAWLVFYGPAWGALGGGSNKRGAEDAGDAEVYFNRFRIFPKAGFYWEDWKVPLHLLQRPRIERTRRAYQTRNAPHAVFADVTERPHAISSAPSGRQQRISRSFDHQGPVLGGP
jgi:hypothetical protein